MFLKSVIHFIFVCFHAILNSAKTNMVIITIKIARLSSWNQYIVNMSNINLSLCPQIQSNQNIKHSNFNENYPTLPQSITHNYYYVSQNLYESRKKLYVPYIWCKYDIMYKKGILQMGGNCYFLYWATFTTTVLLFAVLSKFKMRQKWCWLIKIILGMWLIWNTFIILYLITESSSLDIKFTSTI